MIKETVTYTDFNGEEKTEDLYFNLSRAELLRYNLSQEGGFEGALKRILGLSDTDSVSENNQEIINNMDADKLTQLFDWVEWFIGISYGIKTDDGRFVKSEKIKEEFLSSEAYSELLMKLATNPSKANEFSRGIISEASKGLANAFKRVK
jgi:hypothetical protein